MIKVNYQTMPVPKPGELPLYTGPLDCFKKIVKAEGLRGLYRGVAVPLITVGPTIPIKFFGYGLGKNFFAAGDETRILSKPELVVSGAFGGTIAVAITAPAERVKCLLQVQKKDSEKYKGPMDCARQLYLKGGIRSLYKGLVITTMRDMSALSMYFMINESTKGTLLPEQLSQWKILNTIFAGACAGFGYWLVAMPTDIIKSRIQTAPDRLYPNRIRDVFRDLMAKEGITALYKGITPVMIRALPVNAVLFLGFDLAAMVLSWALPDI